MKNLISFDEYVQLVLESNIIVHQRNPEKPNYNKFPIDLVSKIGKVVDMLCVVINDKELAKYLSSNNEVLYIYYNEKDKIEEGNIKSLYFDLTINNLKVKAKCKNIFKTQLKEFMTSNDIKAFDVVFNISLPINGSDIDYNTVSDLNTFYFEQFVLEDKIGLDRTHFFTLDDKDTHTQFSILINKLIAKFGGKEVEPEAVSGTGKIVPQKLDAYGFEDTGDYRILTKTFLHNSDFMDDFNVEDMDNEEEQEGGVIEGGIVGMKNPTIYCFTTPELPYALKVGETVRPIVVRMNEWMEKAFPKLKFHKSWPATCKKWVFDDHLVHSYILEDTKNRRLQRSDFAEAGLEKNVYSREFFTRDGITDGMDMIAITDTAINNIRSAIKSNYEEMMKKLHRSDDSTGTVRIHSKSFFDERELQKETVDHFVDRITATDKSQDMMIFAVMRFGKTYTAIRCLQEFYKKNPDAHRFSVICTAKPEVKDEWVKGINNYKTDYIDEHGKHFDEGGEGLTERSFNDFKAYGLKELIDEITKSGKVKLTTYTKKTKKGNKEVSILPEDALETYLKGTNEKIVLFLSLQDLSGSIDKVKPNHLFFYKYPVDMLLIDETHYGARGKSYGLSIDAKNKKRGLKSASEAAEDKKVEERINQLLVKDAVKLHLSGTPYRILRNQEFSEKDILAAFTFTDLMEEKENWEKENEEARRKWIEENGDSPDNPFAVEKNPYYGIPQLLHYGYSLSDYELEEIKSNDINTQFAELFKVEDATTGEVIKQDPESGEEAEEGEVNEGYLFEAKSPTKKRPEKIKFVHEKDIIKFFQMIDGTIPTKKGNKVLSILDIPEIKRGNMCKNIIVALPSKDSCDALQELLEREDLFNNFGKYTVINVAGYRHPVKTPIRKIVNSSEKTISLTCSMLLTGVTVPNWDTMFYMKDGEAPESYDQAKFRIQSPYIKEIPIADRALLKGESDKVHKMKLDMKPQTIFVDFAVNRMYKLIAQQMECERICKKGKFEPSKFLKYAPVLVCIDGRLVPMTSTEFSKKISELNAEEGNGIMHEIIRSYMPESFLEDEELMDVIKDYVAFEGKKKPGGDIEIETGKKKEGEEEEKKDGDVPPVVNPEEIENGEGGDTGESESEEEEEETSEKKELTEEEKEELRRQEELQRIRNKWIEFIRNCILYTIVRKDRETFTFDVNKNLAGELIESIKKEENKETVWNIFFNGAEDKKDTCVDFVVKILDVFNTKIFSTDEKGMLRTQFESFIMRAEQMMTGDNVFENIQTMFGDLASAKLGKTEIVTPTKLVKKCVDSDFVIFNDKSRVLDLYGSKIGEFAYYILEDCEKSAGIVKPENYFTVCRSGMVYEFNKVVLSYLKVPEENIMIVKDDEETLTKKLGEMGNFDVIVGNPPYDGGLNPLYMQITKVAYDTIMKDDSVMCMINPTALVDNKFEGDSSYNNLKTEYGDLKLLDFYYKEGMRGVFTSASIGNDIAIFTYGKKGTLSIFDDEIKKRRFGSDYTFDKDIISIIQKHKLVDLKTPGKFYAITEGKADKRKPKIKAIPIGYFCMASVHRGNTDDNTGGHKWDWVTLLNSDNFKANTTIVNKQWNIFRFDNKSDCVNFIKWVNTDFVQYVVNFYKYSLKNPQILLSRIPQPPESGDFSDESLMKEFGLSKDQMEHIHKKMEKFGWKTRDLVKDHKESSLLQFIDDVNTGKAKLPESKKGKKKEETKVETPPEPELPKSAYDMTLDELKKYFKDDYDEWSKSDTDKHFEEWLRDKRYQYFIEDES